MSFRAALAILLTASLHFSLFATHIVGGELTYECLGNDQYAITLTVYRDCYTGQPPFDDPASIGVFDKDWNLTQNILIPLNHLSNDTLPIILSNPCLIAPPDVCVHRTIYQATITLPKKPGGYTLVYQRCCRNMLIHNIIDPLHTGASFTVQISEKALNECNNGAVFKHWPPVAICVHEPIHFDHSATDLDGDMLKYRLCIPNSGATLTASEPQPPNPGPYDPVVWNEPDFSLTNLLGAPPGGMPLYIDSITGLLTGFPTIIGNFVVGVCVDEIRNGQVISTTRRDFQYNVADCGKPYAAFFSPVSICDTLTYRFVNQSFSASLYKWYFDWDGDKTKTSTQLSPTYTFPDTGYYKIALIAQPGDPCSDTTFKTIHVTHAYINAHLKIDYPDCTGSGLTVQGIDQSIDPSYGVTGWSWTISNSQGVLGNSGQESPKFTLHKSGDYFMRLIVTSGNGCMDTVSIPFTVKIPVIKNLADSLSICAGDSIHLFPGADPGYTYLWTPLDFLSDPTSPNPVAKPDHTITYHLTETGTGPCTVTRTIKVIVLNQANLTVTANPVKLFSGQSSQLDALYPGATNFTWEPTDFLSNPNIPNPVSTPANSIKYTVTATLPSGCVLTGNIELLVVFPKCAEPYVYFPTAFSPNGDGQNDELKLESNYVKEVYWVIYNRWGQKMYEAHAGTDAWDGTFNGQAQPAETYGYYLKVKCLDDTEMVKKGNVTLLR
jgi:gliding motility-associated-like protein